MALSNAEYTAIHNKTGDALAKLKTIHDEGIHSALVVDQPDDNPVLTSILYQMQKIQDELDYLRTEISSNKDKTGITTSQASAITANTAKTSMTLGTSGSTALAGDTNIVTIGSSTTIAFGDMVTVTDAKTGKVTGYNIVMTVTNGGVSKTTTLTLT